MSSASTTSTTGETPPPSKNARADDNVDADNVAANVNMEPADDGEAFEFQSSRKLRFLQRKRAIIFSGEIKDFTVTSMAAARAMKGKVKETRMTRNGELIVEVESEENAVALSKLTSLGGVAVKPRESKPLIITKGVVCGVHRSIPESVIVESLRRVGVTDASRIRAHDPRLGAVITTDRVILTFSDGSSIPEQVCVGLNLHAVVPHYEPLQCYRCNMFGHVSKNCQEQSDVCRRCSERGHLSRGCVKPERCINCGGSHSSKFGACPTRLQILEKWRRSTLPSSKPDDAAVPLVAAAPGINAHESFRLGRSYAGVVRNGVRVPQQTQRSTAATGATPPIASLDSRPEPTAPILQMSPTLDIEALTTKITERVMESVLPRLSALVEDIVTSVLGKLMPKFMESIITSLRRALPQAGAAPAAPAFDMSALILDASPSSSGAHPPKNNHV